MGVGEVGRTVSIIEVRVIATMGGNSRVDSINVAFR